MTEEKSLPMGIRPPLPIKPLPEPPVGLRQMMKWIGPGIIIGALATGGYENMSAPYVASIPGGISTMWMCLVGLILSFIMFREASRYTIATGESFFQGLCRIRPKYVWGIVGALSVALHVAWPGWMTSAMMGISMIVHGKYDYWMPWAYGAVIAMYILYIFQKYVYKFLEAIMTIIMICTSAAVVVFTLLSPEIYAIGAEGWFLGWMKMDIIKATALIGPALVGLHFFQQLNPTVHSGFFTLFMRERGHGMGTYMGKVTGLIWKAETMPDVGYTFDAKDPNEMRKWKGWMKHITFETGVIYTLWGCFIFTFLYSLGGLLLLLEGVKVSGLEAPLTMGKGFGARYGSWVGTFFFFSIALSLWDTQWGVTDAQCRVYSDVLWTLWPGARKRTYRFWYY
ncbi:MAG: Nramp family divalent metal transporter, partial [Nitrososphaerota archaeon]